MSSFKNNGFKNSTSMDDYMNHLNNMCEKNVEYSKTNKKVVDADIVIPTITTYNLLLSTAYNAQQLKGIAKNYKLKISGNKKELITRIFCFLKLSASIIKIQKIFRGKLQRLSNLYRGPAFIKREKCTNENDFLSDDKMSELSVSQFFSYQDVDNFIYGFDIISLYNLILKSGKEVKNPYNRSPIPLEVIQTMRNLIRISKVLKVIINIDIKDDSNELSPEKNVELRILDLFQNIDSLGNYSNPAWFSSLNRTQLIRFLREIIDIWTYRAQLSLETKRQICPPNGDPFRQFSFQHFINDSNENIKKSIIIILEKLVNSGIDKDSKSLGAYYVLGALTLVNENAATALPWLFQSLAYF